MLVKKINPRFALLLIFMIVVGVLRVINAAEFTSWSNFTPVGAMALFGGAYFNERWKAFLFPLLTLLLGDLIIHTVIYNVNYAGRPLIYFSFALIVLIGMILIRKVTVKNIVLSSIVSTLTFWMIADFAVWMGRGIDTRTQQPFSRDLAGLMQCYWQGFPYVVNFLLGTLFYNAVMFGLFEWMQKRFPQLLTVPQQSNPYYKKIPSGRR